MKEFDMVEVSAGEDLRRREAALRETLDGGRCTLVGETWFGPGSSRGERERHLLAYRRRLDRNRMRRARRMAERSLAEAWRRIEELPAWVQTRITGGTATVETVDGLRRRVDYGTTYRLRGDPFDWPFPGGRTPLELVVDGGLAVWGFVRRARRLLLRGRGEGRGTGGGGHAGRLQTERRKLCARSTLAACPTATDVRVAWAFARESHDGMLRLGGLLHDLECFLANGLHVRDEGGRPRIVGRSEGIRGWIRENCPELAGKYKTLMRYKALARRLRQAAEVMDPVPTAAVLDDGAKAADLVGREATVQRRAGEGRVLRFAWESGRWRVDARGRPFLTNDNYRRPSRTVALCLAAARGLDATGSDEMPADAARRLNALLAEAREAVKGILAAAARMDAGAAKSSARPSVTMRSLWACVDLALVERGRWWDGGVRSLRR